MAPSRAFPNLDGLLQLSRTEGIDIRPALLRVLTDLYVQEPNHSREEEQQYVELALGMLRSVDAATQAAVAERLVAYGRTAPSLIALLLHGRPDLAGLIRRPAPDAMPHADARGHEAAPQPAPVLDASVDTNAGHVAEPPDDPALGNAFLRGSPAERLALLALLEDRLAGDAEGPLSSASGELRSKPGRERDPALFPAFKEAADAHNRSDFALALQRRLGLTVRTAWQIANDDSGEPLVVLSRAIGMDSELLLRILLLLNPKIGHSIERVFSLMRLSEDLGAQPAAAILASWQAGSRTRIGGKLQPLHAPDASDSLLGARTNARLRADTREPRAPAPPAAAPRRQGTS